ncbi:cell division protein ZapE [Nocardia halotolerans]|uniref:Cell division protein ZapE n=1 Tax=Nocardia halotolerans TaxID=1755878 RepID=A0ABV8VQG0_9NOCA
MILDPTQRTAADTLATLLDRRGRPRKRHRGVYLHGRPGRGKTTVADRFFADVASSRKRRFHFHAFFAALHTATHELGSIDRAVAALLGDADLVYFDEFHVDDIGDARLVTRLLDTLFAQHRTLVVTANHPPADLLPNPLFHHAFVPTIERILAHLDVLALDGPLDYRTLGARRDSGFLAGRYVIGAGEPSADPGTDLDLGAGRTVRARTAGTGAAAFDFAQLCGAPTSAADYLRLTSRFGHWTLHAVPPLRAVEPDPVMRLVNLVDILYDADLPFTIHAPEPADELTAGVPGIPHLARTASRLGELRSVRAT